MVPWLHSLDPFPPASQALSADAAVPGLLAVTQELTATRLLQAYQQGIFPWYTEGQPVLWWSPDPRMVLAPAALKISSSLRKAIKRMLQDTAWEIRVNRDFIAVMQACADIKRPHQEGTWITAAVVKAYHQLHQHGQAHSIETWYDNQCVAGLYGVALGRMFFGESMFTRCTNGSKLALAALCAFLLEHQVTLIDCQQETAHLTSLGGYPIPRTKFIDHVHQAVAQSSIKDWHFDKTVLQRWVTSG